MIRILKASAGSGKTHRLTGKYIELLLGSEERYAYRHILAVTFTNKATAEMKSRILKELDKLGRDAASSPYFQAFAERGYTAAQLEKRATQLVSDILNDYGAFAVSTIDRFFQQTLKAFSREIGRFASYQVELDKKSLVHESVDRILESLNEGSPLLKWVTASVMDRLNEKGSFSLEEALYKMAEQLKSDAFREQIEAAGIDEKTFYSPENLQRIQTVFKKVEEDFRNRVQNQAQAVLDVLKDGGVDPKQTSRGWLGKIQDYTGLADRKGEIAAPTEAFVRTCGDSSKWFSKENAKLLGRVEGRLEEPLLAFCNLFGQAYKVYRTARLLRSQLYELGIAGELYSTFEALLKEKNVLSLDDSNSLLLKIIDGQDTPFVYEKLGVRFEHFLLDEFQDTSRIQWANFRPLLHESDDYGRESLIVGDVKQSIYRWRGSDWNLLDSEIGEEFPGSAVTEMEDNWRSLKTIVDFNGEFFAYAARRLDELCGSGDRIRNMYAGVQQHVRCTDPAEGSVEVTFCPAEEEDEQVLASLQKAFSAGARPCDVAILVRKNDTGSHIAQLLVANGIKVISDDSLHVKSSVTVRRLVSLLSYVENPADTVNSFLAQTLTVDPEVLSSRQHSLPELCEMLLREIRRSDPELFDSEVLYIQSFMDELQEWTLVNGHSAASFLKDWQDADPTISSPDDADAVRIMTVHKAKGLEFPYVIFPYAEEVGLFRDTDSWNRPALDGTPLEGVADGVYQVHVSSKTDATLFEGAYARERLLQYIDNINTFYVALTRAVDGLHVICADDVRSAKVADLLREFVDADTRFYGTFYDFRQLKRKEPARSVASAYPSYPLNGRLRLSADAADFFGEEGAVGVGASERLRGIVLHGILSKVCVPEDLPGAVNEALTSGALSGPEAEEAREWLAGRIRSVSDRGWFPEDRSAVMTECPIADTDGAVWRPDRVVRRPDGGLIVIDYKFGVRHAAHRKQVGRYVALCRRMGWPSVEGYLWYLQENEVDVVE